MAKQIIVEHQKHGEVYWDAPDNDAFVRVALAILTRRWNDGYWYYEPKAYEPKANSLTDEEIAALPEQYQRQAIQQKKYDDQDRRYYEEYAIWYEAAKRVVDTQDAGIRMYGKNKDRVSSTAWDLLMERNEHEYERISTEILNEA